MLTSDELKVLRERGESDANILKRYREFDPETSGDIDTLVKRGEKPGKILDRLTAYHAIDEAPQAEKPDGQADKGWIETYKNATQYGAANLVRGLSKTAKAAGYDKTASALETGAHGIEPAEGSYDPAGSRFQWSDPSTYKYIPRALVEGAPGVAADLTAGAAGGLAGGPVGGAAGFMAANSARNFGGNLEARMENQGPDAKPSASDYGAAGASTLAQAALARLGVNPAISSVAKGAGTKALLQIPGQIAKAAGAEATTGAVGDLVDQAGRTAGTKADTAPWSANVNWDEVGNAGALSGATGGAIRTLRGVGDVVNAKRFSGINEDAAARAVARLDDNGIKADSSDGAYKAVTMARATLDKAISDAHKEVKPLLKSSDDFEETRGHIRDARTILANHGEVPEEKLQAIKDSIGGTKKGAPLVDLLEERQALNQLASKGNFDPKNESYAGGIVASKAAQNILNPTKYMQAKVAAGAAGVAGLNSIGALGVLGANAMPIGASIAGAYGGARLLDSALGLRNPAQEFANRFRGLQKATGGYEGLPDPIAEAQAAAQAAKDTKAQDKAAFKDTKAQDKAAFKDNSRDLKEAVQAATASRKLRESTEAARGKQEDAAWALKARQEAQDAVRAQQADKAWSEREKAPKGFSEDDQWAAHEKSVAANETADLEAQYGIQSGIKALADKALAAQKLRGQQADKAWSSKSKQDAEQAKVVEQADKAWAERQKAPKMPSEEDLWAAHEKAQLEAEGGDLEAQAGIQAGYKAMAQKALAAQQARKSQEDKAWKAKSGQDTAQARLEATVNKDYGRAEAQRNARTPEQIKKAQEDAMWRQQEEAAPADYNEMDAIQAIQRELKARDGASKFILRQAQKNTPAPQTEEGVPEALKVRVRAKAKVNGEATSEAPTAQPETIRIEHRGQVVERPKDDIRNPRAYVAKTRQRMITRQDFADEILDEVGRRHRPEVEAMLSKLNNAHSDWESARDSIEEHIMELPEKHWQNIGRIYNEHEGKLRGTYNQ